MNKNTGEIIWNFILSWAILYTAYSAWVDGLPWFIVPFGILYFLCVNKIYHNVKGRFK